MYERSTCVLLTVKSLKTRFREPLRRAMRAALGWFTIALGFCCTGVLPASDEGLQKQGNTQSVRKHLYSDKGKSSLICLNKSTYWEEDWLGLCACCSSNFSPASKASLEQCLSLKQTKKSRLTKLKTSKNIFSQPVVKLNYCRVFYL